MNGKCRIVSEFWSICLRKAFRTKLFSPHLLRYLHRLSVYPASSARVLSVFLRSLVHYLLYLQLSLVS